MNILSAAGAKMNRKPTDPLTITKEYTYSTLAYGSAYQLKADYEGDSVTYQNSIIDEAYAASGNPLITYIKGNYNGIAVKTQTGGTIYLIATPSIVTSQTGATGSGFDIISALPNKLFVHGSTNSGGIIYTAKLLFFWGSLPSTSSDYVLFASGIALAYSGTSLATQSNIVSYIAALASNNTGTLASLGGSFVSAYLGGSTSTSLSYTPPETPTWTVAGGGDCIYVDNTQGIDINTSTCTDNRTYTHIGSGATHTQTYNLLKIAGKWWFNQNLAYPLATGYQGSNTWSISDSGYYSCPGKYSSNTVDCKLVSTLGYLYQWSAATGVPSNNNDATTLQ